MPDLLPPKYDVSARPTLRDDNNDWMYREFQRLSDVIAKLANAAPQVAYAAPQKPLEGMMRLAKGPWATSIGASPTAGLLIKYSNGAWTAV